MLLCNVSVLHFQILPVCPFLCGTGGDCYAKSRQALQQHLKKQHECDLVNDDGNDWAVSTTPGGFVVKLRVLYKPYPPEECQDASVSTVWLGGHPQSGTETSSPVGSESATDDTASSYARTDGNNRRSQRESDAASANGAQAVSVSQAPSSSHIR